jgi:type III restriction enzyme
MAHILLQQMLETIPEDLLPPPWRDLDLVRFSAAKSLWDYQQAALRNGVRLLWKYYQDLVDYRPGESPEANRERKRQLWWWYRINGLQDDFTVDLSRLNHRLVPLLTERYESHRWQALPYEHFINRMGFWMATGSGKTLVIVKWVEILWRLIGRGEIPPHPILILTHRDDLLEQLKRHVEEFNRGRSEPWILLRELRQYPDVQRETPSLFRDREVTVFYYRSDNLSDEQKERIVDFKNYENDGRWYILLDEAHKGDKEESKRQYIYSLLSRNGFLFNFSATFTDPRDIVTTGYNFNLERFITAGYGKHILILQQEMRPFRDQEDYTHQEKQRVVLKALLLTACVQKTCGEIRGVRPDLYHRPLLLVLVNSVNTEDADLLLFFRELERIARGEVEEAAWEQARRELLDELENCPQFLFEPTGLHFPTEILRRMTYPELLRLMFHADRGGELEVLVRPSNRQELAFKVKTADRPFALIKIGDISGWLRDKLTGYEVNERFQDEGFFARLNEDDSDITVLMGSRTFYEGWDSNRPNVICYINIGVGEDAQKFILQSAGRGVRIEPLPGKRKRLASLAGAGDIPKDLADRLMDLAPLAETLFIFGTNRQALQKVITGLRQERTKTGVRQLSLFEVNEAAREQPLLIPTYRPSGALLAEQRKIAKFEIDREEWEALRQFVENTDDRVLLALHDSVQPKQIRLLRASLVQPDEFYRYNGRKFGSLRLALRRVLDYLGVLLEQVEGLKVLEEEIRHYRHIAVLEEVGVSDLEERIRRVKAYRSPEEVATAKERLKQRFQQGELGLDEFTEEVSRLSQYSSVREDRFEYNHRAVRIRHIARHYYIPVILSEDERVDYLQHIIRTRSEVQFVEALEKYLEQPDNRFRELDWWLFSKLDENLDDVYLPYYDPFANRLARFKPDFIFWMVRGRDYFIVFVDPKGTEHRDADRKLEGYRIVFEEMPGRPREFPYSGYWGRVLCFLWTADTARIPDTVDRWYWIDSVDRMLEKVLSGGLGSE